MYGRRGTHLSLNTILLSSVTSLLPGSVVRVGREKVFAEGDRASTPRLDLVYTCVPQVVRSIAIITISILNFPSGKLLHQPF